MACSATIVSKKSSRFGKVCGRKNCQYHHGSVGECPVCFEEFSSMTTCVQCQKQVCFTCLQSWVGQNEGILACPCCRSKHGFVDHKKKDLWFIGSVRLEDGSMAYHFATPVYPVHLIKHYHVKTLTAFFKGAHERKYEMWLTEDEEECWAHFQFM